MWGHIDTVYFMDSMYTKNLRNYQNILNYDNKIDVGLNINVLVAVKVYRFLTKFSLVVNLLHISWITILVTLVYMLFLK